MHSMARTGLIFALTLGLAPLRMTAQTQSDEQILAALPPDVQALLTKPSAWSQSATLSGGFGYKDNLLLSSQNPEASGFVRGGVEAFVLRAPEEGHDFNAFLSAEGLRFASKKSVDHETQVFLHSEWRYRREEKLKLSLAGQSYFLDQVFDVSDTEAQRIIAQLKVVGAALAPSVRWAPVAWLWFEGRGALKREAFDDGSNDSRITEAEGRIGWKPGERIEASAGLLVRRRSYDHREQYSAGGRPFSDTLLGVAEREADMRVKVTLDKGGHWKLTARVAALSDTDNGEGFFNYQEHKLVQGLEWTLGKWLVQLDGSARRLVYGVQKVGLGADAPPRLKESFGSELRVERKLDERWTVYGEYKWERSRANDGLSGYRLNQGLIGMQWTWEK